MFSKLLSQIALSDNKKTYFKKYSQNCLLKKYFFQIAPSKKAFLKFLSQKYIFEIALLQKRFSKSLTQKYIFLKKLLS